MKTTTVALLLAVTTACASPDARPPAAPRDDPEAVLVCGRSKARLETPTVEAQPDGVHLVVKNTSGGDAGFFFDSRGAAGGRNAFAPRSEHVLEAPPGKLKVGCYFPGPDSPQSKELTIQVRDPNGYYTDVTLDCPGNTVGAGIPEYAPGSRGEKGDPVELTEEDYAKPGDEVRSVGYRDDRSVSVAVVRNGRAVRIIDWGRAGRGRWLVDTDNFC